MPPDIDLITNTEDKSKVRDAIIAVTVLFVVIVAVAYVFFFSSRDRTTDDLSSIISELKPGTLDSVLLDEPRYYVFDKRFIYVINQGNNSLVVLDADSGVKVQTISFSGNLPVSIGYDRVQERIFALGEIDNSLVVHSTSDLLAGKDTPEKIISVVKNPTRVRTWTSGGRVFVGSRNGITVIDSENLTVEKTITFPDEVDHIEDMRVNTVTGSLWMVAGHNDAVFVLDKDLELTTIDLGAGGHPHSLFVDRDRNDVYVSNARQKAVTIVDGDTLTVSSVISVPLTPRFVTADVALGKIYIIGLNRGVAAVIDIDSKEVTKVLELGLGNYPSGIAIDKDLHRVYITSTLANTVSVIDTESDQVIATIPVGVTPILPDVNRRDISDPEDNELYVLNKLSGSFSIIDPKTNTVRLTAPDFTDIRKRGVYYSTPWFLAKSGGKIWVSNLDGLVSSIDTDSKSVAKGSLIGGLLYDIEATDEHVYVVSRIDKMLYILDANTREVVSKIKLGIDPRRITISTKRQQAYITDVAEGALYIVDLKNASLSGIVETGAGITNVVVSEKTGRIYTSNFVGLSVSVIDAVSGKLIKNISTPYAPAVLKFDAEESRLYVTLKGSRTQGMGIIDTDSDTLTKVVETSADVWDLEVDPQSGNVYVSADGHGQLSIFSADGTLLKELDAAERGRFFFDEKKNVMYAVGQRVTSIIDIETLTIPRRFEYPALGYRDALLGNDGDVYVAIPNVNQVARINTSSGAVSYISP